MPGNKTNYFNCALCSKRTKANERREVSRAIKKVLRKTFVIDSFKDNAVICNRCRHLCHKNSGQPVVCARTHQPHQNESSTKTQSSPPSISLPIPSTSKSHAYCCICKKSGSRLVVISQLCRTTAFVEQNVILPPHLEREVRFRDSVSGGGVHIKVSAHLNKARTTHAHLS